MSLFILKSIFQLGNSSLRICRSLHATGVAFNKAPSNMKSGLGPEDGQGVSKKGAAQENAYFKKLEMDMLQRLRGGKKPDKIKASSKKGDSKH